jgi:hypothetical protein
MVDGGWWMVNGEWWMVNGEWWIICKCLETQTVGIAHPALSM